MSTEALDGMIMSMIEAAETVQQIGTTTPQQDAQLDVLRERAFALITIKPRKNRQQSRVVQAQRKIEERKR
jgi:hypothetical protein